MPQTVIINFVHLNPPNNGGASRIGFHVARLLLEQPGVRPVFVVNLEFAPQFSNWLGMPSAIIPVLPSPKLLSMQVLQIRRALSPQLIVSPLFGMDPFSQRGRARHVVGMPDTLVLDHPEQFSSAELLYRGQLYEKLRGADQVVTISQFAANRLKQHLQLSDQQLVVAPLGADETASEPDPSLVPAGRYWLYPANLWPHKRHELLLRVYALAHSRDPELRLILTGDGRRFQALFSDLITSLGLSERQVQHLGYVSEAQLTALYCGAEAMVFTSEYEGFGMPLLEAMQAGCPVICAPLTAIPEVAGDAALYVNSDDPADWAKAAADSANQRDSLVAAGYIRAAAFSWNHTREIWLDTLINAGLQVSGAGKVIPPQSDTVLSEMAELHAGLSGKRRQAQALPRLWRLQRRLLMQAANYTRA